MKISEYLRNIYGQRNARNVGTFTSREWFTKALFFNAGSDMFGNENKPDQNKDSQKIFDKYAILINLWKSRQISSTIRDTFGEKVDKKTLAIFFETHIAPKSPGLLKRVMQNFGIDENIPINKKLFCEALASQFESFVKYPAAIVEDIVKKEYLDSITTEGISITYEQKMEDRKNLQKIAPKLHDLSKLLLEHNFAIVPYPANYYFSNVTAINEALKDMNFSNSDLNEAVKDYIQKQLTFVDYLVDVTFYIDNHGEGHINPNQRKMSEDFEEKMATLIEKYGSDFHSNPVQDLPLSNEAVEDYLKRQANENDRGDDLTNCDMGYIGFSPHHPIELSNHVRNKVRTMQISVCESLEVIFTMENKLNEEVANIANFYVHREVEPS